MRNVLAIMYLFVYVSGLNSIGNNVQTKIIGGSSIEIPHRPYIASIHRRKDGFVCGAIILSATWILTALHCIPSPKYKAYYFIRAGSKFYDRSGSLHILRHIKLYNSSTINDFGTLIPIHDLMLVKIFPRFQFSMKTLPARLPMQNEDPPDSLWVSGWGVTSSGDLSRTLQTVNVKKVPHKICRNLSKIYASLMSEDKHLCYGGKQRDSCNGDSGGPLAIARTVYGIVSFGEDCGRLPGVYVKISFYSDWIKSIIIKSP